MEKAEKWVYEVEDQACKHRTPRFGKGHRPGQEISGNYRKSGRASLASDEPGEKQCEKSSDIA